MPRAEPLSASAQVNAQVIGPFRTPGRRPPVATVTGSRAGVGSSDSVRVMQLRRSLRLTAGAVALLVPLLGSCGFDKATDRVYTPAAGINDRTGPVDVLSAVVVSAQPNSGTFIATLSNNSSTKSPTFDSFAGAEDEALTVGSAGPVEVAPRGYVNLADGDGVSVQGQFEPGKVLTMTLGFEDGDSLTMDVPVVYACEWWTGLDGSAASASPSASPSESPTESPTPSEAPAGDVPSPGSPYTCGEVLEEDTSSE